MQTNKRIRFTDAITRYRDGSETSPQEIHNAKLESFDVVKALKRGSVTETHLRSKPILECGDDLISGYDDGDLYNGMMYSAIKGRCGAIAATPCSIDGIQEYCPPQITHIATINVADPGDKTYPDGLSKDVGNHGIGVGRYVSYIFVPVNIRGEYGVAQYYYFINNEEYNYNKYVVPTFSIGVSDSVEYVEVYRTLERDVNTGLPLENNYYFFDNFYRAPSAVFYSSISFYNGYIKSLQAKNPNNNCKLLGELQGTNKDKSEILNIDAFIVGATYDLREDQDWDWFDNNPIIANTYMWLRGWERIPDFQVPIPVGTEFTFSNLPKGSILDENKTYKVTNKGKIRTEEDELIEGDCPYCWGYYFEFDAPFGYNYIRDVLAGDDTLAQEGYMHLTEGTNDGVTMSDEQLIQVQSKELQPSAINFAAPPIKSSNNSGRYIRVTDYNRWNTSLSTLIQQQLQKYDELVEVNISARQFLENLPDKAGSLKDEALEDLRIQSAEREAEALQNIASTTGVNVSVILDDSHIPPPGAIPFSSIRKHIAFALQKSICVNDGTNTSTNPCNY